MNLASKTVVSVAIAFVAVWMQRGLRRGARSPAGGEQKAYYYWLYAVTSGFGALLALWFVWSF